ncbi:hypothetical protein [Aquabacterium sp. J223]|uniref:hypothetical protein n=1 Tax=Aquabacterium sp. J223 TaxID=2898431 RepID=UPI0021ADA889|nr:hypothetical protein [Aquabacterium sp. J223]UUX96510.1 hypothetical protein LRS07_04150 [Aquabacterium sp. J223]
MNDDFLAPPPFQPDAALQRLHRELRDLGLTQRADAWEWKGRPVLTVVVVDGVLRASVAKRPARTPDWQVHRLADHARVRWLVEHLRVSMRGWQPDD